MSNSESDGGGGPGVQRQKKSKWKRSRQVCTHCRQSKLRCDFLERFPQPCSRCASATDGRSCVVDPGFRRINVRRRTLETHAVSSHSPSSAPTPSSSEHSILPILASDGLAPAPGVIRSFWPFADANWHKRDPATGSIGTDSSYQLGAVRLSPVEVQQAFDEYFQFYNPFCRIVSDTLDPRAYYDTKPFLFWAVCFVGCRPRPDHPLLRARMADLAVSFGPEVKKMMSSLLVERTRSVDAIQALLLLSEYPFITDKRGKEDLSWFYSGFAVQIGFMLGFHRPHFAAEFMSRGRLDSVDIQERTFVWLQTFVIHQTVATSVGLPSSLADDWVTTTVSESREPCWDWINARSPSLRALLRIQRFVLRLSTLMGGNARSVSGQYDSAAAPALLRLLSAELADIEASFSSPEPTVALSLLSARLQLYTFGLQDASASAEGPDFIACYTSAIRMSELLQELAAEKETAVTFWPRSMFFSLLASVLCLLKLASLQNVDPQKVLVDRSVVMKEISSAWAIMKARSAIPGDFPDRAAGVVQLLAQKLAGVIPPDPQDAGSGPSERLAVRSRMSLGNLLYDAIYQAKKAHQGMAGTPAAATVPESPVPVPNHCTAPAPEGHQSGLSGGLDGGLMLESFEPNQASLDLLAWLDGLSPDGCADLVSVPGLSGMTGVNNSWGSL